MAHLSVVSNFLSPVSGLYFFVLQLRYSITAAWKPLCNSKNSFDISIIYPVSLSAQINNLLIGLFTGCFGVLPTSH